MVAARDVEESITRIAQKARRRHPPDRRHPASERNVITGVIRANIRPAWRSCRVEPDRLA
jgi:hypothetical protein